jgi:hypothetical protein
MSGVVGEHAQRLNPGRDRSSNRACRSIENNWFVGGGPVPDDSGIAFAHVPE